MINGIENAVKYKNKHILYCFVFFFFFWYRLEENKFCIAYYLVNIYFYLAIAHISIFSVFL